MSNYTTWEQRIKKVTEVEQRITEIFKDHPRTKQEVEYLAELIMECHGVGDITRSAEKALELYKEILSYMEYVHPFSPYEMKKVYAMAKEDWKE